MRLGYSSVTVSSQRAASRGRGPLDGDPPGTSPQCRHDGVEVRAPDLLGHGRQDVVPDRGEAPDQLGDPRGAGHEPPVEVLAAVAPPADVDAADLADRADRA